MPYLPSRFSVQRAKGLIDNEWGERSLRIEEIWDHIYRQIPAREVRDPRCPLPEEKVTPSESTHG